MQSSELQNVGIHTAPGCSFLNPSLRATRPATTEIQSPSLLLVQRSSCRYRDTTPSIYKQLSIRHIISDRLTKTTAAPTMALGNSTYISLEAKGICWCSVTCSKLVK